MPALARHAAAARRPRCSSLKAKIAVGGYRRASSSARAPPTAPALGRRTSNSRRSTGRVGEDAQAAASAPLVAAQPLAAREACAGGPVIAPMRPVPERGQDALGRRRAHRRRSAADRRRCRRRASRRGSTIDERRGPCRCSAILQLVVRLLRQHQDPAPSVVAPCMGPGRSRVTSRSWSMEASGSGRRAGVLLVETPAVAPARIAAK